MIPERRHGSCLARATPRAPCNREVSPPCFTILAWGVGQLVEVFKWMEQSYAERDPHLRGRLTDPLFESLHMDPRFVALRRRAGLPS